MRIMNAINVSAGVAALLVVAACEEATVEIPASENLSNVYFPPEASRAEMIVGRAGNISGIVLRAAGAGANCSSVSVITAAGETHAVFEGALAVDTPAYGALPAPAEPDRIVFECQSDGAPRTQIHVGVAPS
jgi:hypothetical protein